MRFPNEFTSQLHNELVAVRYTFIRCIILRVFDNKNVYNDSCSVSILDLMNIQIYQASIKVKFQKLVRPIILNLRR
jgi:hypothetical protein